MVQPHPSLLLILDIDESLATEQTRLEVKRCYGYVGSTVIRPHEAAPDGEIVNTMEMHVKLPGVKYLRHHTPEADALWNEMIQRWLFNQFHTVGNQMQIYNRRQREEGQVELYFDWLNVIFEGDAFSVKVKLNSVSSLPPECSEVFANLRDALCDGMIDESVDCVLLPALESFEGQVSAWEADESERLARQAAEEEERAAEADKAQAEAVQVAEENFVEAPDLVQAQADSFDEESWQAELERKYSLPDPDFEIDYTIWGVVEPGGSVALFDSSKQCFISTKELNAGQAVAASAADEAAAKAKDAIAGADEAAAKATQKA